MDDFAGKVKFVPMAQEMEKKNYDISSEEKVKCEKRQK